MLALGVLFGGVAVASSGAILVRIAQAEGVASLAIAAWRMLIASAILLLITALQRRRPWADLAAAEARLVVIAGVLLGLHFAFWISSLALTSVASSVALVTTTPIWVGLATVFVLRQRLPPLIWCGIGVSLAGMLLILWADGSAPAAVLAGSDLVGASAGSEPVIAQGPAAAGALAGNLLALGGALTFGAYLLIGRQMAGRLPIAGYVTMVYTVAAATLVGLALFAGAPLAGYPPAAWLALAGLAIGPQLLGHTAYNWAVGRLSPTFVSVATLGEPIASAALAAIVLAEIPRVGQLLAFGVLLAGIGVAGLAERSVRRQAHRPLGAAGSPGTDRL